MELVGFETLVDFIDNCSGCPKCKAPCSALLLSPSVRKCTECGGAFVDAVESKD